VRAVVAGKGDQISISCALQAGAVAAVTDLATLGLGKIPGVKQVVSSMGKKMAKDAKPLKKHTGLNTVTKEAERDGKGIADKKSKGGGGGKDKVRRIKTRVKCFCTLDYAIGGRDEYDRQLKHQQDGINSMSVDEYLAKRGSFTGKNPCTGVPVPKGPGRDKKVTKNAKDQRQRTQAKIYSKQMREKGLSRDDAKRLGSAKAQLERNQQNALHNQDMVAGGDDAIGTVGANGKRTLGDADFGFGDTNQHIGTQWPGERVKSMDNGACEQQLSGEGSEKMNVELRACGKHEAKAARCKLSKKK